MTGLQREPLTLTAPASAAALDGAAIDAFRSRLRGSLLRPEDPGYDDARTVWNGMIDRRPTLVVRCLGVADVVAAVAFAREHDLPLTIKGGGHNIAGLAVADGAVTLDLSPMRGVRVDPGARLAWAQAGCLLGDVDRETRAGRAGATELAVVARLRKAPPAPPCASQSTRGGGRYVRH